MPGSSPTCQALLNSTLLNGCHEQLPLVYTAPSNNTLKNSFRGGQGKSKGWGWWVSEDASTSTRADGRRHVSGRCKICSGVQDGEGPVEAEASAKVMGSPDRRQIGQKARTRLVLRQCATFAYILVSLYFRDGVKRITSSTEKLLERVTTDFAQIRYVNDQWKREH